MQENTSWWTSKFQLPFYKCASELLAASRHSAEHEQVPRHKFPMFAVDQKDGPWIQ